MSMSRPRVCRRVGCFPEIQYFKPRGILLAKLEEVALTVDEFEAIRLADLEGLYQEQAAEKMNISRQTFGRIIESGHRKIAEALVKGKALKIEGGDFDMADLRKFKCLDCQYSWNLPFGEGKPLDCPYCKGGNIQGTDQGTSPLKGLGKGKGDKEMKQKKLRKINEGRSK